MLNIHHCVIIYPLTQITTCVIIHPRQNHTHIQLKINQAFNLTQHSHSCLYFPGLFTCISTEPYHATMRAPDVPARPVYLIGVRYSIFSRALNEVNTTRTMSLGGLFPYKCAKIPQIINNENENFAVKTIENFKKYHEKRGIFHQMFSHFKIVCRF